MGLKKLLSKVVNSGFGKAMDTAVAVVAQPVKSVVAAVSKSKTIKENVVEPFYEKSTKQQVAKLVTTGIAIAAAPAVATSIATSATVGAGVTKVVAATVIAPAIVAAVIEKPKESLNVVANVAQVPGQVYSGTTDILSGSSLSDVIKNNPAGSAAVAAVAGIAAGVAGSKIAGVINAEKALAGSDQIIPSSSSTVSTPVAESTPDVTSSGVPITPTNPTTPEMVSMDSPKVKKTSKRAKAKRSAIFNNNIQVNIANVHRRSYNRKYIKEIVYA
jgi:hypothetical protein